MTAPTASIHHFNYDPASGDACYDEDDEPLIGYYYEIHDDRGNSHGLMGPYNSKDEVEAACNRAWNNNTYKA
jgi:hypothetical protein